MCMFLQSIFTAARLTNYVVRTEIFLKHRAVSVQILRIQHFRFGSKKKKDVWDFLRSVTGRECSEILAADISIKLLKSKNRLRD